MQANESAVRLSTDGLVATRCLQSEDRASLPEYRLSLRRGCSRKPFRHPINRQQEISGASTIEQCLKEHTEMSVGESSGLKVRFSRIDCALPLEHTTVSRESLSSTQGLRAPSVSGWYL
jgi:hypothetical protein